MLPTHSALKSKGEIFMRKLLTVLAVAALFATTAYATDKEFAENFCKSQQKTPAAVSKCIKEMTTESPGVKLDKNGCLPSQKKRGLAVGMAESDIVCSSWGKPTNINEMTTKYGTSKWYWYHNNGSSALHITNGVIDSIHN